MTWLEVEEHRVMFPYQRVVSDGGAAFCSKVMGHFINWLQVEEHCVTFPYQPSAHVYCRMGQPRGSCSHQDVDVRGLAVLLKVVCVESRRVGVR